MSVLYSPRPLIAFEPGGYLVLGVEPGDVRCATFSCACWTRRSLRSLKTPWSYCPRVPLLSLWSPFLFSILWAQVDHPRSSLIRQLPPLRVAPYGTGHRRFHQTCTNASRGGLGGLGGRSPPFPTESIFALGGRIEGISFDMTSLLSNQDHSLCFLLVTYKTDHNVHTTEE